MRLLSVLLCVALATCVLGTSPFALPKELAERTTSFSKRAPQATCQKWGCESGSGQCGVIGDTNVVCTTDNRFCLLDNTMMGMCTKPLADGQTCSSSTQCMSQYCSGGVCTEPPTPMKQNGESCTTSSQCVSNICTSGMCHNIASGDSCSYSAQCAADYYCMSQSLTLTCAKRAAMGEECMPSVEDSCMQGLMCGASERCMVPYTTMSGALCADSTECMDGMACMASSNGTMMCGTAASSSRSSCSFNSDCTRDGETCQCNGLTGAQECTSVYMNNVKGLASAAKAISECLVANCNGNTYGDACAENSCKKQVCKFTSTNIDGMVAMLHDWYPKCYLDYFSASTSESYCGSASSVALSAAAVAAALVAYLL